MKIAIIGATGFVGSALLSEASARGHEILALARNTEKIHEWGQVSARRVDVFNADELAAAVAGCDVVISAFNGGWTNPDLYNVFLKGAQSIQKGVKAAGVKRFIVIGGAGSLEVAPGVQLVDTPEFPAEIKAGATAARDYLNILKEEQELDWSFVSPAIEMHPGTSGVRRNQYRVGKDSPVVDENGRSILSVEDLAVAVINEAEEPQHSRQRFTVAY